MKRRIIYIGIICGVVILVAGFFVYNNQNSGGVALQKCPDDYADTDAGSAEYLKATNKWTNIFFDMYPGATMKDWAEARYQFLVDNKCKEALKRYKDAKDGKADPTAMEQIDNIIWEAINNPKYYSELGFLFNYPKDMYVMNGSVDSSDNYRLFVVPDSYEDDGKQDLTAVVISASLNQPFQTPLEWLEGPDSGADMSKGYTKLDIDGQEGISINGGSWITFNTPDKKYQISIATLPGVNPNQSLQDAMSNIVKSIVFSK